MSLHPRQQPVLKAGVGIQLQSAFSGKQWATAMRLADKQAKLSQDPYYEVVKVCAETQQDSIADKAAAAVLADAWARSGTMPKDLESVELLEWACEEARLRLDYGATFGVLRFRWVKANPRNVKAGLACLHECLQRWDLVNAQQIATVLDKSSNANDRRFPFWNILLSHLLAASPQCPEAKRKIYGMLAQKQLEKAAELAEAQGLRTTTGTTTGTTAADRSLRDEEDFLLYFRVLAAHGTADNYATRALHPRAGALAQLAAGRKHVFDEVVAQLEAAGRWDAVFDLCRQALEATTAAGQPSTMACDLRVWNRFVAAAEKQADVEGSFDVVQQLLGKFVAARPKLPFMYGKNVGLAVLQLTFRLPASLVPAPAPGEPSLMVAQLLAFLEANRTKSSVFADVRGVVEQLPFAQARDLVERLAGADGRHKGEGALEGEGEAKTRDVPRAVLVLRLRYLLATCPETRAPRACRAPADGRDGRETFVLACKFCGTPVRPAGCPACLRALATDSLQLHASLEGEEGEDARPALDRDPRIDLALVAASSLLRLAGLHRTASPPTAGRRWTAGLDAPRLLQAALVLGAQQRATPDDIPLRLLAVRLALVLGCAAPALQLWTPLGVKRTILDALGPLLYDRLSTVAPGAFLGTTPLLRPLHQYYAAVLRPAPVRLWDAFAAGSYSSILDMAAFSDRLHRSCTRVMTVVESRRAARTWGAKMEDVEDLPIFADITHDVPLVNATDYGSLPNLESSFGPSLAEVVALGPGLSDLRMHLGLLAERFLDLINFRPAKEYKPLKPADAAARDKAFLHESLSQLQVALSDRLHQPHARARAQLTAAEYLYYSVVAALASFLAFAVGGAAGAPPPPPLPPGVYAMLGQTLATSVDLLRASALPSPLAPPATAEAALAALADLHSLAMLRDAAVATRQTAAFVAALHDRETARDRSGKAGLGKEVLAEARAAKALAARVLADIKAHIKATKDALAAPGWLDRIVDAVAAPAASSAASSASPEDAAADETLTRAVLAAAGGRAAAEAWAGRLLEAWRDNIAGWNQVPLE